MIHYYILILLALILPLFLGSNLFGVICRERQGHFFYLERLFISFGLGMGLLTLTMFYMSLFGIHFSFVSVGFWASLAVAILSCVYPSKIKDVEQKENFLLRLKQNIAGWKIYEMILLFIIICAIAALFFRTLIFESDKWDSWAVWGFKAKIYFVEKIIPFQKFSQFKTVWGNWDYPHHVPLMETWVFLSLGQWNDQLVRMIFPIYHLGLVVCLYAYFRRHLSRMVSLCGGFFIVTVPIFHLVTTGAYAEPVLLFYYILSFRFLLEWKELNQDRYLLLSAVFSGLAAWTKNEGIVYSLFNLLIILIMIKNKTFSQKKQSLFLFSGIVGLIICPWLYKKASLGLGNTLINQQHFSISYLIKSSLNFKYAVVYWVKSCFRLKFLYFFRFMLFPYLILNWKSVWKGLQLYLILTIFFHVLLAVSFFFLDPTALFLTDAFNRLLIAPSILMVMLIFYPVKEESVCVKM